MKQENKYGHHQEKHPGILIVRQRVCLGLQALPGRLPISQQVSGVGC